IRDDLVTGVQTCALPIYTMVAAGVLGLKVAVRAWVPIDDDHCFGLSMSKLGTQGRRSGEPGSNLVDAPLRADSSDWYGRFRFEEIGRAACRERVWRCRGA